MHTSTKFLGVAVAAEVILIATGLGLAAVQARGAYEGHGDLVLAGSAAAFPLLLAVLELFKIPAGISLYRAGWALKPFAALLLAGGMVATFETVTMAGSTWFRALQFEITAAQADLDAMRDRRAGSSVDGSRVDEINAALQALDRQLDAVSGTPGVSAAEARLAELTEETESLLARRGEARARFAGEWDAQTGNNSARIASGNAQVAEQALASQRSMPTRQAYIGDRMTEWDADDGRLLRSRIGELQADRDAARAELDAVRLAAGAKVEGTLDALRAERSRLQDDLMAALDLDRQVRTDGLALGREIEAQEQRVARLAADSVIYDIAAKAYGSTLVEVTEEQANVTTFWVILGVGLAASVSTGLAAFLAACLAEQKRSAAHLRVLRQVDARRRALVARDTTIAALKRELAEEKARPPKIVRQESVVYRYLPVDRDLASDDGQWTLARPEREVEHAA